MQSLPPFSSSSGSASTSASAREGDEDAELLGHDDAAAAGLSRREPPAYSPLDAYTYSEGVHIDLPAELISAALERGTIPSGVLNPLHGRSRSERRRSRRRGNPSS